MKLHGINGEYVNSGEEHTADVERDIYGAELQCPYHDEIMPHVQEVWVRGILQERKMPGLVI